MYVQLAGMRLVEAYLHLPRIEPQLQAATADKKSKQSVQTAGGSKCLSVDPVIDEAGGDTEVAIVAPASIPAAAVAAVVCCSLCFPLCLLLVHLILLLRLVRAAAAPC